MSKVYIPNKGCHDYSKSSKYGEIVFLTQGLLTLTSVGRMYREMLPILEASSKNDHILISGPTIANIVACSIFQNIHGRVNLLIYKRNSKKRSKGYYKRRCITFSQYPKEEKNV